MGVDHLLKSGSWLGEPDFWPSTVYGDPKVDLLDARCFCACSCDRGNGPDKAATRPTFVTY
jgi:hypothetical protein